MGFPVRLTIPRRAAGLALCVAVLAIPANGQPDNSYPGLGTEVAIIDQLVSYEFDPVTVLVLRESASGRVEQFRAEAVALDSVQAAEPTARSYLVGAPVPLVQSDSDQSNFHFTFFAASRDAAFAATAVKGWTRAELVENSPDAPELKRRIAAIEQELKILRVRAIDLEEQLAELRGKAAKIANIEAIIELKAKIATRQSREEDLTEEMERLRALIETGRQLEDPPQVDEWRHELSEHLREAAKVTAVADRLNRRKREAALQSFLQKLNLVKEMQQADPEALAQEILALRKERRELERRLGITSGEAAVNDF
ncbi:MAG: hypothetical protein KDD69_07035 [Bdellovibrionales bacterium]|nr:hypothetical protein [Bdellovibrionales bacterium]